MEIKKINIIIISTANIFGVSKGDIPNGKIINGVKNNNKYTKKLVIFLAIKLSLAKILYFRSAPMKLIPIASEVFASTTFDPGLKWVLS